MALASPTGMPFLWNTVSHARRICRVRKCGERASRRADRHVLEQTGRAKSGILSQMPLPEPELSASLCFDSEIRQSALDDRKVDRGGNR